VFQKVECNSKTISKTLEKLVELYKKWTMPKDKSDTDGNGGHGQENNGSGNG